MVKCYYCDYEYDSMDDLGKHLNTTHTKCICGKVFDKKPNFSALCDDCFNENKNLPEGIDLTRLNLENNQ